MTEQRREVVVITGASAGVGRATVRRFARDGAWIGLIARGRERLEAAAREVEDAGGRALVLPADVADPDAVEAAAARVEEELGPIDIWVNNAMTSVLAPAHEVEPDEYRRVTEVNYLGFVYGTLAALRRMRPRDSGVIIQVGSALAFRGIPLQAAYCGSKHAIQGFTESLRAELIHYHSGVHVGTVHMPALNTPQFDWVRTRMDRKPQPVPPIYQPEVAADAIHWAAHNRRTILYVGYPTVETVLGNRVSSRALDYYLARTGFDSQQTDQPEEPDRPDNLFEPVPGDFAAHGRFDEQARDHSPQLWASKNRAWIALAGGAAAAFAAALAVRD
jgi:NAD(P)-dependent dehydrogenase (short-subunit alcohol dehydrogenase family)